MKIAYTLHLLICENFRMQNCTCGMITIVFQIQPNGCIVKIWKEIRQNVNSFFFKEEGFGELLSVHFALLSKFI